MRLVDGPVGQSLTLVAAVLGQPPRPKSQDRRRQGPASGDVTCDRQVAICRSVNRATDEVSVSGHGW